MEDQLLLNKVFWKIRKFVSKGDYLYAVVPEHPNKNKNNYVLAHRVIMENFLGHILTKKEIVHHINGNKKDNSLENLQVMSIKEHCYHHISERGHTILILKCPNCQRIFEKQKNKTHVGKKKGKSTFCSRQCLGKFSRKIQLNILNTEQLEKVFSENVIKEYNSSENSKQ